MTSLSGQVGIVTGASRGIGHAIALELARHGLTVVINYRENTVAAEATAAEITSAGGRAVTCRADVSSVSDVQAMIARTMREFGRIDALVCNAAVARSRLAPMTSDTDWQRMHATGLWGSYSCITETVPHMMALGRGTITCISSIVASRGSAGLSGYAAVKGGVEAMVRSLAVELGPKGIRVNAVAPGVIQTDMTRDLKHLKLDDLIRQIPQRRVGEAQEIAKAVRFLASDDAGYITGAVLAVDGGLSA